jgi:hypothetical protein
VTSIAQKFAIVLVSLALLGGGATLALAAKGGKSNGNAAATQYNAKAKCNSGRGNGSEIVNGVDCDPGNSGGHNKGGD